MQKEYLEKIIDHKKKELKELVYIKDSLQDNAVYKKSCELDKLVVQYMKATG